MSATETLRNDHKQIKRLGKIISKCYTDINAGKTIPFSDLEKITIIISEFWIQSIILEKRIHTFHVLPAMITSKKRFGHY